MMGLIEFVERLKEASDYASLFGADADKAQLVIRVEEYGEEVSVKTIKFRRDKNGKSIIILQADAATD